ncbi:MAG TPA: PilN domain-containing protein [Thermoanaerobaculia bacterium]|jgi:type IV pilus assembly protein PilN|nr:PilN domain-containing protein [Thermoanaerobaculia bacterium]
MVKINLLSEGKRPAAVRKAKVPAALRLEGQDVGQWMLLFGVIVMLGLVVLVWMNEKKKLEAKQEEVTAAQREVEAMAAVIKEVDDYKAKKAELERKIGIINDLKANQRGPVRVMDYVSRALPELLWLDRMQVTGNRIQIEGRAFNTNAVANFIENLDKVPEFDEPTLGGTEQQAGGVYRFNINFNYSFATHKEPGTEGAPSGTPETAGSAAPATSG